MYPTKEKLIDLIGDAQKGELVLPEFQRSFIWERRAIEDLLVSVLNDYFIGTLLLLNIRPADPPFRPRLIEGMNDDGLHPQKMVLDGQQRLTSIYYALYAPDLPLKNTVHPYRFFLRIDKALEDNWDDAVFSWPAASKKTEQYMQSPRTQHQEGVLPFGVLTDWMIWRKWHNAYSDYHEQNGGLDDQTVENVWQIGETFLNYQVATVQLEESTSPETVVEVFERINSTGTPLGIFELLTARLWKYDIKLRDLWESTLEQCDTIREFASDKGEGYRKFILQVIALMRGRECKRKELILLEGERFATDWHNASAYVEQVLRRITNTTGGYGVIKPDLLAYSTMVTPLACMLRELDTKYNNCATGYEKTDQWYWSSVFGERYGGSTDTVSYRDFREMQKWLADDEAVPENIKAATDRVSQLNLRDVVRAGAIYKGVMSLVALHGALDFHSGQHIELHQLDDHHIFPRKFLETQGYKDPNKRNTILNRTLISSDTNRKIIGDHAPSQYLAEMEKSLGKDKSREVLATHFIDHAAYDAMQRNDYESFLDARQTTILSEIRRRCTASEG